MLGVYASAAAILLASLVLGRALLHLLGRTDATWLSGAVGFAALVVAAPLLIRLPGRAATSVLRSRGSAWRSWRCGRAGRAADGAGRGSRHARRTPGSLPPSRRSSSCRARRASLPFVFNERNGALGEGIYTNDQARAALLDRLAPARRRPRAEGRAVRLPDRPAVGGRGRRRGDRRLAAETPSTGSCSRSRCSPRWRRWRRSDGFQPGGGWSRPRSTGLPYLAASFLAQSAFKETAMALLVLAFAVALGELGRPPPATIASLTPSGRWSWR